MPQGWGAGAGGSRCRRGTVPRGLLALGAGEVPCPRAAGDAPLSRPPQTERAYQKQPTIFQNKKRVLLGEGGKEKLPRYYKNIGLGFKTPKEVRHGWLREPGGQGCPTPGRAPGPRICSHGIPKAVTDLPSASAHRPV